MSKKTLKPIAAAIGTTFVVSLATSPVVQAADNPFAMNELSSGYMVVAEGNCGDKEKMEEMKEKEGKCGDKEKMEEMKEKEGNCGDKEKMEEKKEKEGNCGNK